jgi:hypothetical protein
LQGVHGAAILVTLLRALPQPGLGNWKYCVVPFGGSTSIDRLTDMGEKRIVSKRVSESQYKQFPESEHIMADKDDKVNEAELAAEVASRETEVNNMLTRKDKKGALAACLVNPPVTSKDAATKDRNSAIVEKVIASITDSEVQSLVDALNQEALDVLMKYLYRIMGKIDKSINYALLLRMHALVSEKAGIGTIVRSLTERKLV